MPQLKHASPDQQAGTIPQAARRYGLGVRLIRELVAEGVIPIHPVPHRPHKRVVFFVDIEAYLGRVSRSVDEGV